MSNKLTDKTTSDTQPSTLVAIIGGAVKLLNWSGLITLLNALYVPLGRTINGHALNANVTITKSDVSLGNVTNDAQLKAEDLDTDATMAANSDTKIPSQKAVKAYANSAAAAAAAALVNSAPSALDTLKELSDALGADANFAATTATALGNKQDKSTLGSDVATAVHAATGKSTPVDGDELLMADSAASYALKKLTWANLKATLKTYFDGLYNLYVLPAPGTTTLGGVKRNAGSSGQYVKGIDTDGALIYDTPAGGGGGAGLTDPFVAHLSSDGNDTTGDGSPGAPFLTAQAAVNAGYFVLRGGVGSFGNITISAPSTTLWLLGVGRDQTIFGDITMNTGSVIGNGVWMLQVARITFTASAGAPGADGVGYGGAGSSGTDGPAGYGTVSGCYVVNEITVYGGVGGTGGGGGPGDGSATASGNGGNGGFGGSGGSLNIDDCNFNYASCRGGNGGAGGNAPYDSAGQGNGGNGGTAGQGGIITMRRSIERTSHDTPPGLPGAYGLGGVNGSDGDPGSNGSTTIGPFSQAATGTDTSDTVLASIYNGTFTA